MTLFSSGGAVPVTSIDGGPFVDLGRVCLLELDKLLLGLGFVALFDIGWFYAVGVARIWSDFVVTGDSRCRVVDFRNKDER